MRAHLKTIVNALCLALSGPGIATAAACTVSAGPMAYGVYQPSSGSPTFSTSTINVTCLYLLGALGSSVSYTLGIGSGVSGDGTIAGRKMAFGASLLRYQVYSDAARISVWGDGSGASSLVQGACAFLTLNLSCTSNQTVYGSIPNGQWVAPGAYVDTVMVTVTY